MFLEALSNETYCLFTFANKTEYSDFLKALKNVANTSKGSKNFNYICLKSIKDRVEFLHNDWVYTYIFGKAFVSDDYAIYLFLSSSLNKESLSEFKSKIPDTYKVDNHTSVEQDSRIKSIDSLVTNVFLFVLAFSLFNLEFFSKSQLINCFAIAILLLKIKSTMSSNEIGFNRSSSLRY